MLQIKLFILRIICGRYSYSYHRALQSIKHYKRKRKNYNRSCSRTDSLNHYRRVKENRKSVSVYKCEEMLQFGNVQFGMSFSKVRRSKINFQCYDITSYEGYYWRRIGYKERLFNAGVKRIYHFLNDEFFFGELSFSDIRDLDDKMITGTLIEKYTGKSEVIPEGDYRIDFTDGFIYVENSGINLSIKYISEKNPENAKILNNILTAQSGEEVSNIL